MLLVTKSMYPVPEIEAKKLDAFKRNLKQSFLSFMIEDCTFCNSFKIQL